MERSDKPCGKIKANNEFINKLRLQGREYCFICELPYPSAIKRSVREGPVLVVVKFVVLFNTLEEGELERLRKELA